MADVRNRRYSSYIENFKSYTDTQDKTKATNYRVISIDSAILKIFEIAIKNKLMTVEPLLKSNELYPGSMTNISSKLA